jgi:hypothetical protein
LEKLYEKGTYLLNVGENIRLKGENNNKTFSRDKIHEQTVKDELRKLKESDRKKTLRVFFLIHTYKIKILNLKPKLLLLKFRWQPLI